MRKTTLFIMALVLSVMAYAQTGTEVTFDFNAINFGVSTSSTHDGDITENTTFTAGDVSLVVSPSGVNTPNRFWLYNTTQKVQLRVYGGTLTLSVPEGHKLTKMVFNNIRWDAGNEADSGFFQSSTWTGNAEKVVVSIAGNTQLDNIVCTIDGEPGEEPQAGTGDLVVLPEGVQPETWTIDGVYSDGDSDYSETYAGQVAFDGNDVYIQGLAYYFDEAWIKGTITGSKAVFPSGQFVGEDEYGKEYVVGTDDGTSVTDIVFTYDAAAKRFTLENFLVENDAVVNKIDAWGYWAELDIYEGEPQVPEAVVVPENLATAEYSLKAVNMAPEEDDNGDYTGEYVEEPFAGAVMIGFDGSDVYIQGLCNYLPQAWVKATLSSNGLTATIPSNQYLGTYSTLFGDYDFYITDGNMNTTEMSDLVITIDAEKNTLTASQLFFNSSTTKFDPLAWYKSVVMTKLNEVAAIPATPEVVDFSAEGQYPYVEMYIPAESVDGQTLLTSKLSYMLYIEKDSQQTPLTLTAALYDKLSEDMTEIPYRFTDDWDIALAGETVYLNQPLTEINSWTKIGVQSIYRGGGVENKSQIGWYDIAGGDDPSAVKAIADGQQPASVRFFDMQGRSVAPTAKGMLIKQTTAADGSVKTRKVIN